MPRDGGLLAMRLIDGGKDGEVYSLAEKTAVYLLSVHSWPAGLTWVSWIYSAPGREAFFVDPAQGTAEVRALSRLAARMPVLFYDLTGDAAFGQMLSEEKNIPVQAKADVLFEKPLPSFGLPKGIVTASPKSPGQCLHGAIFAVRLGYLFLPEDFLLLHRELLRGANTPVPLVYLGSREQAGDPGIEELAPAYLPDEEACFRYLAEHGLVPDYLLMLNSADLQAQEARDASLSAMWVKGLSLLGTILASYRNVFTMDIGQDRPDSREMETRANELVRHLGWKPAFQVLLGAPGALPFIIGENRELAPTGEEPVRDIHVQLNHDLFYDVAEGRLFQSTPGGLSLQLLSSKYYHKMERPQANQVLIAAAPHVESGIIFDSDQALIEGRLKPLLEEAGHQVTLLTQRDASLRQVAQALPGADFFLYSGHGSQKSFNTHGRFLVREDLPELPPLVAYASACSTMSIRPDLFSPTEGLDWEEILIPPRQVIGLAMVEKGALCFIGGATTEDFQFTSSVYSLFFESLLLKGMSVGAALNETRNFVSLYVATLHQKAPEAYSLSKEGISNIIHQQILLGDPALVPCPKIREDSAAYQRVSMRGEEYEIVGEILPRRWKRVKAAITEKAPTQAYYRTRAVEYFAPLIPDIISWGDFYHLAFDCGGISEKAVMSVFWHLQVDLPPGQAPEKLALVSVAGRGQCLCCGKEFEGEKDLTRFWQDFVLPYQMLPPVKLDMKKGWPFTWEDRGDTLRIHWLVPVLVIDEKNRRGYFGEKIRFQLKTMPGKYLSGKVMDPAGAAGRSLLVKANQGLTQAVCDGRGEFRILCGKEDTSVEIEESFPLYHLLENYTPLEKEVHFFGTEREREIKVKKAGMSLLKGKVLDTRTGDPIPDALLRVWRGKPDPCGYPLREGWAGEVRTDQQGSFSLPLAPGAYLLYFAAQQGSCRYKSKEVTLALGEREERYEIYSLDRAGVVKGKVVFAGRFPPGPTLVLKKYPLKEQGETLTSVPLRNDGTYECLVSFQDRFCITIEKEGWQGIRDTNSDQGYQLAPEEILSRDYFLDILDMDEDHK